MSRKAVLLLLAVASLCCITITAKTYFSGRDGAVSVEEVAANHTGWMVLPDSEKQPERFEPFLEEHPDDEDHRTAALIWYSRRESDPKRLKHHTLEMINYHPGSMYIYFANLTLFYREPAYLEEVIKSLEDKVKDGSDDHEVYWVLAQACEHGALPRTFQDEQSRQRFLRYFGLPDDTPLSETTDERLADKSQRYYRLAMEKADEEYRGFYARQLVDLLVTLKRPQKAVALARDILTSNTDLRKDADFLHTFGRCLKEVNELAEAETILKQVRRFDKEGFEGGPAHATTGAEMLLGELALDRNDPEIAARHLVAALHVQRCCHNSTQGVSLKLAQRLLEAGQYEAVVEFCETALEKFVPGQPETKALLERARETIAAKSNR